MARPDIREIQAASVQELLSEKFHRDPMRPLHYDPTLFYSPADGFVLCSRVVGAKERIVEVKGRSLTARELLQDARYSVRSLVISIFLTFYDVHVNRIPTDGYLHFRRPAAAGAESMATVEAEILRKNAADPRDMEYTFTNERVVTRVYTPRLLHSYYIVQIADREVDTISLFAQDGDYLKQGQRFAQIRFGSQVNLIIPLTNPQFKFNSLVGGKDLYHLEAGNDPVVKVEPLQ